MFGSKIMMASIIGVTILVGLFYWYYTNSQNRIQELIKQNTELLVATEQQEKAIASLIKEQEINERQTRILSENLQEAEEEKDELASRIASLNFNDDNGEKDEDGLTNTQKTEVEINETTTKIFNSIGAEFGAR